MRVRRQKFLLFLLLIFVLITFATFAYVKKEIFFQRAKKLIEQNLEQSLQCRLSIEKIRPSVFADSVLENLEISFPQVSGFAFNIKVDQVRIGYNLWEAFFLGQKKDVQQLRLISPTINLSYPQAPLAGNERHPVSIKSVRVPSTNIQSNKKKFASGDFVFILEGGRISFGRTQSPLLKNLHGRLLLSQNGLYFQDIRATFNNSPHNALKIYGELRHDQLSLTANLEHLKIKNSDMITNLALTLNKKLDIQNKVPKISGTLKTYGSVLNNRPFPELNSSFEIRDSKLCILTLNLGDNYNLRGIVNLTPPFHADVSLNFYQAALSEFIPQFTPLEKDSLTGFSFLEKPDFSGLLNGLIKITGALSQPKVEGYLEAKHGHIGDLDFVSANINIKGRYPKILIVDSRICREEDTFFMEGEINFTDLEKQDLLDIRVKADKGIFWQGWDITRRRDNHVHMSKSIADDLKVTFDTIMMDEASPGFQDNYINELGLECQIFGDKLLKLRLKRDEEILGVERRIKF